MQNMFQAMIEHLQQMDDVMEAVKAKLEEGYVIKNDFHQTILHKAAIYELCNLKESSR